MFLYSDYLKKTDEFSLTAEVETIGRSVTGLPIHALKIGSGAPTCLVQAGIHAREFITTELTFALLQNFAPSCTFFVVPLSNPDGFRIATEGVGWIKDESKRAFLSSLCTDFSSDFKANANGVDLNVNFDAEWGCGVHNVFAPACAHFIGKHAESEPETVALVNLTERVKPVMSISLHAKGEQVFWKFGNDRSYEKKFGDYAEEFAALTGYELCEGTGSCGGYKDWFIKRGFGFGLTLEVGSDCLSHPITSESLGEIYRKTKEIFYLAERQTKRIFTLYGRGL